MKTKLVFLKGQQVLLRPPLKTDVSYLLQWINDPEVNEYLGINFPMLEKDEEKWIESISGKDQNNVMLILTTTRGLPIGTMGLHDINWVNRTATTGALIGNKRYWSKGYGSEAKMLLLNYAFNRLNLRKICSAVIAFNNRSKRYSEKCGYRVEACFKKHIFRNGKYWDLIHLAVYKNNWQPIWEKYQSTGRID